MPGGQIVGIPGLILATRTLPEILEVTAGLTGQVLMVPDGWIRDSPELSPRPGVRAFVLAIGTVWVRGIAEGQDRIGLHLPDQPGRGGLTAGGTRSTDLAGGAVGAVADIGLTRRTPDISRGGDGRPGR